MKLRKPRTVETFLRCSMFTVFCPTTCEILKLQKLSVKEQLLCGLFFKHIHHTSKKMLVRPHVCSSRKISIATPWMVTGDSGGGGGGIKSQTFKVKVEFPEKWGFEPKNHPWKGYGYFLEPHFSRVLVHCSCCNYVK